MKTQIHSAEVTRKIMKTGRKIKSHGSYRAKRKPNSPRLRNA
jgi:hypothetical protein